MRQSSKGDRDNQDLDYEAIDKVLSQYVPIDDFRKAEEIGKGGYGIVYKAYWKKEEVAVKVISLLEGEVVLDEMDFNHQLRRHANIIQIHGFCRKFSDLYIFMELAERSLHEKIKAEGPQSVSLVLKYGCMIASALSYAKSRSILHRDIKTENILCFPNDVVKLTDFGLALFDKSLGITSIYSGTKLGQDGCGTDKWQAPELANVVSKPFNVGDGENLGHRGEQSDVYSFGLVIWSMLTGGYPYFGVSAAHYEKSIGIRPPDISKLKKPLGHVVKCCLKLNYKKRPSFQTLETIFKNLALCSPQAIDQFPMDSMRSEMPSNYSRIEDMYKGELCEFLEDHDFHADLLQRVRNANVFEGFFTSTSLTEFQQNWLTTQPERDNFEKLLRQYNQIESASPAFRKHMSRKEAESPQFKDKKQQVHPPTSDNQENQQKTDPGSPQIRDIARTLRRRTQSQSVLRLIDDSHSFVQRICNHGLSESIGIKLMQHKVSKREFLDFSEECLRSTPFTFSESEICQIMHIRSSALLDVDCE